MTIHWKAHEEHFLLVPLLFQFTHFLHFQNFLKEISVLKELSWSSLLMQRISSGPQSKEAATSAPCGGLLAVSSDRKVKRPLPVRRVEACWRFPPIAK
jgi:hypothetical protein